MPELPEVETVRMGLAPVFEGHTITRAETRRGDLRIPFPRDFTKRLSGQRTKRLWRRAKYLLADLESGETLVMHLGMSGRMSVYAEGKERRLGEYVYDIAPQNAGQGKHDHVILETDAPARIVFTDHRRFGLMTLIETSRLERHALFKDLGVEPLSDRFDPNFERTGFRPILLEETRRGEEEKNGWLTHRKLFKLLIFLSSWSKPSSPGAVA